MRDGSLVDAEYFLVPEACSRSTDSIEDSTEAELHIETDQGLFLPLHAPMVSRLTDGVLMVKLPNGFVFSRGIILAFPQGQAFLSPAWCLAMKKEAVGCRGTGSVQARDGDDVGAVLSSSSAT